MTAIAFVVPGSPVPWQRAGGHGRRRFTPPRQRVYQAAVRAHAAQALRSATRHGIEWGGERYLVEVLACWPDARQRDIDNALKSALDAMQRVLYPNDAKVDVVTGWRHASKKSAPHLVVMVEAMTVGEAEHRAADARARMVALVDPACWPVTIRRAA